MSEPMSLVDYASEREYVVLFWTSVGTPMGDTTPLGYPDLDFPDRNGLFALTGTVEPDGDWTWDGHGDPRDDRSNSILQLHAYPDRKAWERIVEEYESEY